MAHDTPTTTLVASTDLHDVFHVYSFGTLQCVALLVVSARRTVVCSPDGTSVSAWNGPTLTGRDVHPARSAARLRRLRFRT